MRTGETGSEMSVGDLENGNGAAVPGWKGRHGEGRLVVRVRKVQPDVWEL